MEGMLIMKIIDHRSSAQLKEVLNAGLSQCPVERGVKCRVELDFLHNLLIAMHYLATIHDI